jgi:hypothetical protein
MTTLVQLRHGDSDWNRENRFTGWTDVDLSEKGGGHGGRRRPGQEGGDSQAGEDLAPAADEALGWRRVPGQPAVAVSPSWGADHRTEIRR